jgi:hypothetical protein
MKQMTVLLLLAAVAAALATAADASQVRVPARWKNCTAVNRRYPHGVGRNNAHDHTSGIPVTNFKHSTRLYNTATHYNKSLDRDKDGIACEKA